MATKVKVNGKALDIINAIDKDSEDELNDRRFSRLCSMLPSPKVAWQALAEHGKDEVVRTAKHRLNRKMHASHA